MMKEAHTGGKERAMRTDDEHPSVRRKPQRHERDDEVRTDAPVDPYSGSGKPRRALPRTKRGQHARAKGKAGYYLRRIYELFLKEHWTVRYRRIENEPSFVERHLVPMSCVGFVDADECAIYVDFRKEALAIIVHEALHVLYPDLPEGNVRHLEAYIMEQMSPHQARRLHGIVAEHLS